MVEQRLTRITYPARSPRSYVVYHKRAGQYHHDTDPAYLEYTPKGELFVANWYRNGQLHRDYCLPAVIQWSAAGQRLRETYYIHGQYEKARNFNGWEPCDNPYAIVEVNPTWDGQGPAIMLSRAPSLTHTGYDRLPTPEGE